MRAIWIVNWQAVLRRFSRHVSRHVCHSRSLVLCVVCVAVVGACFGLLFVAQGSSCRLLFDLELAGT